MLRASCFSLCLVLAAQSLAVPTTRYVDDDASPGGDGTSWPTAFMYLQDALAVAAPGDEIHVAAGTYRPDRSEVGLVTPGDRTATFQLLSGVGVYGGYRGCPGGDCPGGDCPGGDPNERDIALHETILSGDLTGDDAEVASPEELIDEPTRAENSYHVTTGSGTDATAVLSGFVITGGNSDGPPQQGHDRGGGMYNWMDSRPTVLDCTFTRNVVGDMGGGMYCIGQNADPIVVRCRFRENVAASGGGMANLYGSEPVLSRCIFEENWVELYGGGICNNDSNPTLSACAFTKNVAFAGGGLHNIFDNRSSINHCRFSGNTAVLGGAMHNGYSSDPTITGCVFSGNAAPWGGGGIYNYNTSSPALRHCTFTANWSGSGATIAWSSSSLGGPSVVSIANCIFRNGGSEVGNSNGSTITISYSNIQGGYAGVGNIDADPLFVRNPSDGGDGWGDDPDTPDVDESANDDYGDLHLSLGSPCIDAGDNTAVPADSHDLDGDGDTDEPIPFDLDGFPRFVDDPQTADTGNPGPPGPIVDMGAYEFGPDDCRHGGGLDHDGDVDLLNHVVFNACLAGPNADPPSGCDCFDLDANGHVDLADAAVFQRTFTGE